MAKKNGKPQERLIHINAQSKVLSVMEIMVESKVVDRLIDIRDGFKKCNNGKDYLIVKTCVVNPRLPFPTL